MLLHAAGQTTSKGEICCGESTSAAAVSSGCTRQLIRTQLFQLQIGLIDPGTADAAEQKLHARGSVPPGSASERLGHSPTLLDTSESRVLPQASWPARAIGQLSGTAVGRTVDDAAGFQAGGRMLAGRRETVRDGL